MSMDMAAKIACILGLYAGFGAIFAVRTVNLASERVDAAARGASWGIRLVLPPGAAGPWPLRPPNWLITSFCKPLGGDS